MSTPNANLSSSRPNTVSQGSESSRPRGGWRGQGRGRGRTLANVAFEQSTTNPVEPQDAGAVAHSGPVTMGGRGRGRGGGRGGRGGKAGANQPRPTHFLALPLHTHEPLRNLVSSFQSALLSHNPPIAGLDNSIVIDPRRLHLTLGVMALEEEGGEHAVSQPKPTAAPAEATTGTTSSSSAAPPTSSTESQPPPKHTVQSALTLLTYLKPQIAAILSSAQVKVPLERMDVFPPGAAANASVLFLGPKEDRRKGGEWERLWRVADLIHTTFKSQGYITDTRPLKLHCTILNASHRKPRLPRMGFSHADILKAEGVIRLLGATNSSGYLTLPESEREGAHVDGGSMKTTSAATTTIAMGDLSISANKGSRTTTPGSSSTTSAAVTGRSQPKPADPPKTQDKRNVKWPKSSALPVKVGAYHVATVELWVMGSRGENNEYVSLGGVSLE